MDFDGIGSVMECRLLFAEMLITQCFHDVGHRLQDISLQIAQIEGDPSVRTNRHVLQQLKRVQAALRETHSAMRRDTDFLRGPARRHPNSCHDLESVIEQAVELLQPTLRQNGCSVTINAKADDLSIKISEPSLREILISLIINSAQADAKTVRVSVDRRNSVEYGPGSLAMDNVVVINVQDDGHGILLEPPDSVFAPQTTTRSEERGAGFGLFIARALARRSGGELMIVDDESGSSGASFSLVLPADDDI